MPNTEADNETNEYEMQFSFTPKDFLFDEDSKIININFCFSSPKSIDDIRDWQDQVRIFAENKYSTCDLGMREEGTFSFHLCDLNDSYLGSLTKIRQIYEYALSIVPK